jgi:glycerol-3-phosphate acyltransferase PlsY
MKILYLLLYMLIPLAYIIGSIPFGVLISRTKGIDLRQTGSKNIGTTNVLRSMGKIPALATLLGDALKGTLPVLMCRVVLVYIGENEDVGSIYREAALWEGIVGLMAIIGHIYSIFLSFKGGKGVATSLGVIAVYSPVSAISVVTIWLLVAAVTRYSSLAAICASFLLPFAILLFDYSVFKIYFGIFTAFLVVLKHRDNIKRLVEGREPKFGH